ncbi:MAG: chemotaxis protein CheW [Bdellovibrio sp.]
MSFSEQEIEEFKAEALELLELAEKSLLGVDQGDTDYRKSFDAAFRCFHSLKGASGMMDLVDLQHHMHELENVLVKFKDSDSIPREYISFFLKGIDDSRNLLAGKDKSNPLADDMTGLADVPSAKPASTASVLPESAVQEFICECNEIVERISEGLQALEKQNFTKDTIDGLYRDIHSLKGSAYLFSYNNLGNLSHAMESSLEGVRNGTHAPSKKLIDQLFKSLKIVEVIVEKINLKQPEDEFAIIVTIISKTLIAAAKELPVIVAEEQPVTEENLNIPSSEEEAKQNRSAVAKEEGASSIRVSISLLDNLMTLMGEMVLVRNQVLQFANRSEDLEFLSMSKRLNAVTSEIQGEMMKTRMQPIGNVLTKFNRIVRDLSHELNKSISLNLFGAETELDKSLLEAIKDPLTHIVRNSCDHGIETAEQRKKSGKPAAGQINIKSYHEGGQVVIEISDDGKGLDKEMILKKAVEKGLASEEKTQKLSEKEIFNLIFAPGFSTAAKVTNVSGRGVGMDVVRTNIERIGGTVDVSSVVGTGTMIKIKIPLTLAIIPALIVTSSGSTFAVPQVKLEELVRVDQSNAENRIEVLHGAPVLRLRGNILPLVDLNAVLNSQARHSFNYENGIINIAVLNAEQSSFGLIIDEVQDTADIVVKPLNNLLKSLRIYSGATILGNGAVALILDVLGMSKMAQIGLEKVANAASSQETMESLNALSDTQDYLLIQLNSPTKQGLVLSYVHRLEEFQKKDVEYSGNQRVIRYRNNILPLINANEKLGYGPSNSSNEVIPVVVIHKGGQLFGIEVDEIIDTLSTTIEMDTALVKQPGIFGSLNTRDELVVVIDPFEIISLAFPNLSTTFESRAAFANGSSGDSQSKGHILLVEDTVLFRKLIRTILENDGYRVTMANNGEEALNAFKNKPENFDLIISDIEMPKIDGYQLARSIRKNSSCSQIPMIAVSSLADAKHVNEGFKAGFNIYLEKLNQDLLLSSAAKLIEKRNVA